MNIGLIGLPRSGKSTVFHLLTGTDPDPSAAFKREVLHGVTHVPDPRVDKLAEMSNSKKIVYVTVEYVDTPGMEAGASKTDWFTGSFAAGLKTSDALLLVVKVFGDSQTLETLDPLRDLLSVQDELILADLVVLENKLERLTKQRRVKLPLPEEKIELEILTRGKEHLEAGKPLRTMTMDDHEKKALRGYQFLSEKPVLAVLNTADDTLNEITGKLGEWNEKLKPYELNAIALSAKLEGEIANLEGEEQTVFMADLGVTELARDRILRASFNLLGLQSFLTTGDKESRAWQIHKGDSAVDAAAAIHTDLARAFIRAEVVHYDDFVREGGYPGCKAKGLVRLEGKEYPVKDGDILVIRHSG